jgi:hypothetical protein
MKDYNLVAIPMKLNFKLSKLKGKEIMNSNNYWSMIGSVRYLTCLRHDIAFVMGSQADSWRIRDTHTRRQ